ncbi:hypothetical protein BKA62DRAFT_325269 [Auriculariales sp. MPI-PUGE-AT-0066]|nr:hypothetical protein BKA62DRAFT_325269 [Auriculariales sp. MPI-PUGE-AT-0066]
MCIPRLFRVPAPVTRPPLPAPHTSSRNPSLLPVSPYDLRKFSLRVFRLFGSAGIAVSGSLNYLNDGSCVWVLAIPFLPRLRNIIMYADYSVTDNDRDAAFADVSAYVVPPTVPDVDMEIDWLDVTNYLSSNIAASASTSAFSSPLSVPAMLHPNTSTPSLPSPAIPTPLHGRSRSWAGPSSCDDLNLDLGVDVNLGGPSSTMGFNLPLLLNGSLISPVGPPTTVNRAPSNPMLPPQCSHSNINAGHQHQCIDVNTILRALLSTIANGQQPPTASNNSFPNGVPTMPGWRGQMWTQQSGQTGVGTQQHVAISRSLTIYLLCDAR